MNNSPGSFQAGNKSSMYPPYTHSSHPPYTHSSHPPPKTRDCSDGGYDDLAVVRTSLSLLGVRVDLIVTGSIAAVESLRLIRALRRLGAEVKVVLSRGGAQFITPMSLAWASCREVMSEFSGSISHLSDADLCVVAPASAHFLARLCTGGAGDAAAARVLSYLGRDSLGENKVKGARPPLIVVPCMHDSLLNSPFTHRHVFYLEEKAENTVVIWGAQENGKRKFPDSDVLADEISHHYHRSRAGVDPALVIMGATRAYIDDVRFMQSYSSGALGSEITEELYRWGMEVRVICGDASKKPKVAKEMILAPTYAEMHEAAVQALNKQPAHVVMVASVLDYVPRKKISGKVRSGREDLKVELKSTEKIRSQLSPRNAGGRYHKICFKLEPEELSLGDHVALWRRWRHDDGVDLLVMNALSSVSREKSRSDGSSYRARVVHSDDYFFEELAGERSDVVGHEENRMNVTDQPAEGHRSVQLYSKRQLARYITGYLRWVGGRYGASEASGEGD